MATEEELNKQNQFQREFNRAQAESVGYARSLTEEIKDQLGVRSRLNESQRSELSLAREIQKSVAQNNVELGNTGKLQQAILKDRETLNRIDLEIQLQKQDLTSKGFKLATQIAEKQKEAYELQGKLFELERLAEELKGNALAKVVEEYEIQSNKSAILEKQLKDLQETAYLANNITQAEIDKVAVLTQLSTLQQENLRQKGVEEELQKKINDEMGVTGAVVTGLEITIIHNIGVLEQVLKMTSIFGCTGLGSLCDTSYSFVDFSRIKRCSETFNNRLKLFNTGRWISGEFLHSYTPKPVVQWRQIRTLCWPRAIRKPADNSLTKFFMQPFSC